jgi:hypothetical protein
MVAAPIHKGPDDWATFLRNTGQSGAIPDMESSFLASVGYSATSGSLDDRWRKYADTLGYDNLPTSVLKNHLSDNLLDVLTNHADFLNLWDFADLSTLFQDTAGTTPVTTSGQSIKRVNDKGQEGNNLTEATNVPTWQAASGSVPAHGSFDGIDDKLTATLSGTRSDVSIYFLGRSTSTAFILAQGDDAGEFIGCGIDGQGTTIHAGFGTPTIHINGGVVANSRDLFQAGFATGGVELAEFRNSDASGVSTLDISAYSTLEFDGDLMKVLVIASGSFLTNHQTVLTTYLGNL